MRWVEGFPSYFSHDAVDPLRREAVEGADVAYCLEFGVEVLRGTDDAVLGGVDVGVSRFGYTDMDLSGCIRTSR